MLKPSKFIAKRLKNAIESAAITKNELIKKAHLSPSQLHAYLTGTSLPGLEALENMAFVLKTTPAKLLSIENEVTNERIAFESHDLNECYRRIGVALKHPVKRKEVTVSEAVECIRKLLVTHETNPDLAALVKELLSACPKK